jgi:hypothetical protein
MTRKRKRFTITGAALPSTSRPCDDHVRLASRGYGRSGENSIAPEPASAPVGGAYLRVYQGSAPKAVWSRRARSGKKILKSPAKMFSNRRNQVALILFGALQR